MVNSDRQEIFSYRSDPEICKYQSWKPISIDDVDEFISTKIVSEPNIPGSWMQFAICLRATHQLIGDCGIHFLENEPEQVEVGITIKKLFQGRGYASEALTTVFNYIFFDLKKHRIVASIDPENFASIRLMEKMNMCKEAHFRKSIWMNENWVDDVVYAILAEEWAPKN